MDRWCLICGFEGTNLREWLSWWSTTLPRSGSRVRVPSRALMNKNSFIDENGIVGSLQCRFFVG